MREGSRDARPGANLKFVQPVSEHVAFTVGRQLQPDAHQSARQRRIHRRPAGRQLHHVQANSQGMTSPVPMDVPRIRYEFGTRRVGSSPPIADAGPNQLGIAAGTVTLNGCGSYDPLGLRSDLPVDADLRSERDALQRQRLQRDLHRGRRPDLRFRLTVRNTDNLPGAAPRRRFRPRLRPQTRIVQFTAIPAAHPVRPVLDSDAG